MEVRKGKDRWSRFGGQIKINIRNKHEGSLVVLGISRRSGMNITQKLFILDLLVLEE
jgi:hypothetical protein